MSRYDTAYLKAIANELAAEIEARAVLIRAQHALKGRRLGRVASINLALAEMAGA